MKLAKYARLVKRNGLCYICHVKNEIWLGTRAGIYKAYGLPDSLDEGSLFAILDFDSKQADKTIVEERYFESVHDVFGMDLCDGEFQNINTSTIPIAAIYKGKAASALICDDGELIFYDETLLAPVSDVIRESQYIQTVVRKRGQDRYILIQDGMDTLAAIMPMPIITKEYLLDLGDFHARCTEQLVRLSERSESEEDQEQWDKEDIAEKEADNGEV